jgi:hypothetical protein
MLKGENMKRLTGILILAALLISLAIPVFAVHGGLIVIGNEQIFRIRHDAPGMTIQQRADVVTQRLNELLGCPCIYVNRIKVVRHGEDYAIMYGKQLIITVDKATAKDNSISAKKLARQWANNLKRVLPKAKAENCGASCTM